MRTLLIPLIPFVSLGMLLTAPAPAKACGGTFCDNGPQVMPVDQTGEVIVFAVDENRVEAHIQIQYDPETEAERFAWLVPVTSLPDVTVGSQQLFLNLLNSTVPSYGFQTFNEQCDYGGGSYEPGCTGTGGGSSATGGDPGTTGDTTGNSTEVLAKDSVGAFDYVVLQSMTVPDLMQWLSDNDFYQDPAAEPILQEYIDEGHLFVAFRMTQGAEIDEIHPITISYDGTEPCVPIRLTRIAAQEDMDIRAFFLADDRFVPTNYRHVEINTTRLDWFQFGPNYKEVVTQAVDSQHADGHAFVTEYAGPSFIVPQDLIFSLEWSAEAFTDLPVTEVVNVLQSQGLIQCAGDVCESEHALMMGILNKHVPVPDGLEPGEFYSCLECFEDQIDPMSWDWMEFVVDLTERVIVPGQHAIDLLTTHDYVSRLYTTISPGEMTIDPMFHANADLPEVDETNEVAEVNNPCEGRSTVTIPGFSTMELQGFQVWPEISPETMPWAERVEQMPPAGSPQVLIDNHEIIEQLIDDWNGSLADILIPRAPDSHSCSDDHTDSNSNSNSNSNSDSLTGADTETDSATTSPSTGGGGDGCGCSTDSEGAPVAAGLSLLALLGLSRRRRS